MRMMALAPVVMMVAACSGAPQTPVAGDAYVRLAAVPGRPAAGYAVLHGGAKDSALVQITAPGVARIELHNSRMTGNGMMAMDAVKALPVPRAGTVTLAPGGYHAMLFGVPAGVTPGTKLPLTFRFDDGTAVEVPATVIGAGEAAPE
ncbi:MULTISPECIES: copper chaperone PCu(A)C [Sphingomonas]|uniref:Copper chaperone PCu(A)C n=1 Tax=Sphingomonas adhaesiva TaxID=28212 RepID=A0A2A4I6F3_9SPHN|nr:MULTISPECIES: copper chaperone PCu(A)C [Sphingomonas]PCG14065.1 copper chaperone PCu(A)C [Sphingomonas adhaesiva]PZU82095.1 MAG: copper chaperone PCu(A)C [Sphingomonas sp.]